MSNYYYKGVRYVIESPEDIWDWDKEAPYKIKLYKDDGSYYLAQNFTTVYRAKMFAEYYISGILAKELDEKKSQITLAVFNWMSAEG